MSDRILVCLPDGRWLALDRETFDAGLAAGASLMNPSRPAAQATASSKLMSAEEMADATGVPSSWYASQARERRIPFRKIGRYVRFDYTEVLSSDAFNRRAIPAGQMNCTGHRDRKASASA
ncbi:MAG TPA: hypothetical protein VN660_01075 [Steroidobacteraceae bacterium]|nr:hypothetical protein [Steroidobacteraceae bacterium]